jgi:cytoskeletal protein CcmA (bactofilin family)
VVASEDLNIDGRVEGRITVCDHHLTIGADAQIKAELFVKAVTIRGAITGNITATEKVQISETGSVQGNIVSPRLAMLDGATLAGRVSSPQDETPLVAAAR